MKTVAIDFETANYPRNSAIALGVSVIENDTVTDQQAWLFKPPLSQYGNIYIRPDFIDIHGITVNDVKNRPDFSGMWDEIAPYIADADMLIAHNAGFDRSVLFAVAEHYEIKLPTYKWRCTVNLSRQVWPELYNHKLSTVAEHLGIDLNHHDALSDAHACAQIFIETQKHIDTEIAA